MDAKFVMAFFSAAALFLAYWLESQRANKLAAEESVRALLGLGLVSAACRVPRGVELLLKTNTGKYRHVLPSGHAQAGEVLAAVGKLVTVSLTAEGQLRFQFAYEPQDSVSALLGYVEEALREAVSEWPLEGAGFRHALGTLASLEGSLDLERAQRALAFWEAHYAAYPSIRTALAEAGLAIKRQKTFTRLAARRGKV